ncbi:thioredoxin reductase-like selenoprotein T homolog CG3887 [Temnothorax curvispinosus]|uniref:Thioredoxin reductase-like selenoprotein T homolog CG3887 n=2 Tax=Temnothorax TaxID=300110 RepID=A0A6J1PU24_9HYME|nr:thioredoxin reductase-like selenoprotein T homolog CG3887 [Temnothorax curvispinosus]TGZ51217.1 SelT-like protein [Temnothorax longispinosus]
MRWLIRLCALAVLLAHSIEANSGDEAPLTKLGAKTGPTLKFFYCYSCGYKKAYEQYVSILKQKYPELHVEGENFNPPGHNMLIAKALGTLKILIIILICGSGRFNFGLPLTSIWQWCINNRFYSCILIFLIGNAIEGQLISSGAFEIHFNDVPVWSKLETGRIPQPLELFQIIDFHLDMQFSEMDVGKIKFQT